MAALISSSGYVKFKSYSSFHFNVSQNYSKAWGRWKEKEEYCFDLNIKKYVFKGQNPQCPLF